MTSTQKISIYIQLEQEFLFSDKERERESGVGWQDVSGEYGLLFKF
jgi:hypothetical protein